MGRTGSNHESNKSRTLGQIESNRRSNSADTIEQCGIMGQAETNRGLNRRES